jgi:AcrR family transcriptional regulator
MAIDESQKTDARSTRMPAAERRVEIINAAAIEFATRGLYGTATEDIANRAGITQPYVFRLFGTKKALFLAVVEHTFDEVQRVFQVAMDREGARDTESVLMRMGRAYGVLLHDRTMLLMQMQAYAASDDDEVRAVVQRRYGALYQWVQESVGAEDEEMHRFFANGMLLNVAAAIDLPSVGESWVAGCLGVLVGDE